MLKYYKSKSDDEDEDEDEYNEEHFDASSQSPLSSGAIAGIVIGIIALILIACGVYYWLVILPKNTEAKQTTQDINNETPKIISDMDHIIAHKKNLINLTNSDPKLSIEEKVKIAAQLQNEINLQFRHRQLSEQALNKYNEKP